MLNRTLALLIAQFPAPTHRPRAARLVDEARLTLDLCHIARSQVSDPDLRARLQRLYTLAERRANRRLDALLAHYGVTR